MKKITWNDFDSVVVDLDGTLLNHERVLSAKTKEMLELLHRREKKIFIATGRPWYFATTEIKHVNTHQIVSCNGALVYDIRQKEPLLIKPIDVQTAKQIFQFLSRHRATFVIYAQSGMFAFSANPQESSWINWLRSQNSSKAVDERFTMEVSDNFEDSFDFYEHPILEFIVVLNETPSDSVAKIWEYLREQHSVYPIQSQTFILDIMSQNISKGSGLEELAARELLDLKRTIVFGDQYNDISMFEKTAFSVAMGNARDFVKSKATFTTLSNSEDGIHHFFTSVVLEPSQVVEETSEFLLAEEVAQISDATDIYSHNVDKVLEAMRSFKEETPDFDLPNQDISESSYGSFSYVEPLTSSLASAEKTSEESGVLEAAEEINSQIETSLETKGEDQDFVETEENTDISETTSKEELSEIEPKIIVSIGTRLFELHSRVAKEIGVSVVPDLISALDRMLNLLQQSEEEVDADSLEELMHSVETLFFDLETELMHGFSEHSQLFLVSDKLEELYDKVRSYLPESLNSKWLTLLERIEEESQQYALTVQEEEKVVVSQEAKIKTLEQNIANQQMMIQMLNSKIASINAAHQFFQKYHKGQPLTAEDFKYLETTLLLSENQEQDSLEE